MHWFNPNPVQQWVKRHRGAFLCQTDWMSGWADILYHNEYYTVISESKHWNKLPEKWRTNKKKQIQKKTRINKITINHRSLHFLCWTCTSVLLHSIICITLWCTHEPKYIFQHFTSPQCYLYSTFYHKNCLYLFYRGRNAEPELPDNHSGIGGEEEGDKTDGIKER